jgi:hypothetical protein
MVLGERHWTPPGPASALQIKIEESIAMSQKRQTKRRWIVHRQFEANRLSPAILVQAYAQIVPPHVRVLRLPAGSSEAPQQRFNDPQSNPLDSPITPENIKSSGDDRQTRNCLVIDAITKQEAR